VLIMENLYLVSSEDNVHDDESLHEFDEAQVVEKFDEITKQAVSPSDEKPVKAKRKRWYVLNVYSGYEDRVASEIYAAMADQKLNDIEEIFVPKEKIREITKSGVVEKKRSFFSGYIFVRMVLTDAVLQMISSLNRSAVFLGDGIPLPVRDSEMVALTERIAEASSAMAAAFIPGERVRVCDGAFNSFIGTVKDVDEVKGMLHVSVFVFGQDTPVGLSFSQVEKIED
jgi:transcriptional antiterminator NusG